MRNLGAKLSDAEIKLLIAEADQDGDGQISAKEFISFVYSGKDK
jgi:Ca2+-binding EF-hand superfamily protein